MRNLLVLTVQAIFIWTIITCEFEMRLQGDNDMEGSLLMNISNSWSLVTWTDHTTLKTVCKLLGYGFVGIKYLSMPYLKNPLQVTNLTCSGNETSITDCSMIVDRQNLQASREPGILCSDQKYTDIQLIGGLTPNQGQVVVKVDNRYGSVCTTENGFEAEKNVICRTLGYRGANLTRTGLIVSNSTTVNLHKNQFFDLRWTSCIGNESGFSDCQIEPVLDYPGTCWYMQRAQPLQLDCLECEKGQFGAKCDPCPCFTKGTKGCDETTGRCPCDQLSGSCTCKDGWTGVKCDTDIDECEENPCNNNDVCENIAGSFICKCPSGDYYNKLGDCEKYEMMLLGDNELEGVLLMNISGLWGTVSWTDDTTLKTVCKLLGYGFVGFKALEAQNNHPLRVTNLTCDGTETSVTDCNMTINQGQVTSPNKMPAIHCFDQTYTDIQLIGGLTPNQGQVVVKVDNRYGSVCTTENGFEAEKNVLCRTLGYRGANLTRAGLIVNNSTIAEIYGHPFFDLQWTNCIGNETRFVDCRIEPVVGNLETCMYMSSAQPLQLECLECDEGKFGVNCAPCPCFVKGTKGCDGTTGRCPCDQLSGSCTCKDGWTGVNCDTDVNECDENPCNETNVCENSLGSFICKCPKDETLNEFGDCLSLEEASPKFEPSPTAKGLPTVIIASSVGGSVGVAGLMLGVLFYLRYRQRLKRKDDKIGLTIGRQSFSSSTGSEGSIKKSLADTVKDDDYNTIHDIACDKSDYTGLTRRNDVEAPYNSLCRTTGHPDYLNCRGTCDVDDYLKPVSRPNI